jgi:hypothetical protein
MEAMGVHPVIWNIRINRNVFLPFHELPHTEGNSLLAQASIKPDRVESILDFGDIYFDYTQGICSQPTIKKYQC